MMTKHRVRGANRDLVDAARALRQRETSAEQLLWLQLRGRQLDGLKFRRQYPIGPFVLDFCCPAHRLVIELDGGVHDDQIEQDQARTDHLIAYGYRVLRIRNEEIHRDLSAVVHRIRTAVTESQQTKKR